MRGLLDTSVVIAREVAELPDEAAISAATLAELHVGVLLARNDAARSSRLRRLTEIESRFDPLPIDAPVARSYGMLAHATVTADRQPRRRALDLLIAATAHAHDVPLYTRDRDDLAALGEHIDVRLV
ncbi:type II toxin-antitoxin system VapC family toxin [Nitriliruptor alkaliphilus]|uniref:type II toxin-antitoxin system VapC family toxin n=1 Tax=Nitriliruptor alkaliphilus TaxID=427918 RepID=UPI001B80E3C2|nr:type II toxin-antitoxin system VapC family toxin [Nitriliruptor alkaliphilus]